MRAGRRSKRDTRWLMVTETDDDGDSSPQDRTKTRSVCTYLSQGCFFLALLLLASFAGISLDTLSGHPLERFLLTSSASLTSNGPSTRPSAPADESSSHAFMPPSMQLRHSPPPAPEPVRTQNETLHTVALSQTQDRSPRTSQTRIHYQASPPTAPPIQPEPIEPSPTSLVCLQRFELSTRVQTLIEEHVAGVWGGSCTCPDGVEYSVGDNADYCASLACIGGVSGECKQVEKEAWAGKRVTCGRTETWSANPLGYSYPLQLRITVASQKDVLSEIALAPDMVEGQPICATIATPADRFCFELVKNIEEMSAIANDVLLIQQACHELDLASMRTAKQSTVKLASLSVSFDVTVLTPPSPPLPPHTPPAPPFIPPSPYSPPPISPPSPPPYKLWPGKLDSAKCKAMLRDPAHVFRRMWAVEGWAKMSFGPACWDVHRDAVKTIQPAATYFDEAAAGVHCPMNWYEGNPGLLGLPNRPPVFSAAAPALYGADDDIGKFCEQIMLTNGLTPTEAFGHAGSCIAANINILNIFSARVPYNICRNFEWQVCSAKGLLPGQGSNKVMFATAPKSLDPNGRERPLGQCTGWRPQKAPTGGFGYTNDDIFYLEVCIFNQICKNGPDVFKLDTGVEFECEFSDAGFEELKEILLLSPPTIPKDAGC